MIMIMIIVCCCFGERLQLALNPGTNTFCFLWLLHIKVSCFASLTYSEAAAVRNAQFALAVTEYSSDTL